MVDGLFLNFRKSNREKKISRLMKKIIIVTTKKLIFNTNLPAM